MPYIHIIHVGSTTNKGTYVLLKTEILELRKSCKNVRISVSTSDIESLRKLEPSLRICPPLVDIPYERADLEVKKRSYDREGLTYKLYLLAYTLIMFLQAFFSIISSALIEVNLKAIYRSETITQLNESDLIISTADENFKEGSSYLPYNVKWKLAWWSMLFSRMLDILIAKKVFRKSIVVFPNSVGPFRTRLGRFMARMALDNVDLIMLREPYSYSCLKDLKVKTPTVTTSDIAILFKPIQRTFFQGLVKPAIGVSPGLYAASFSEDKQREYVLVHSKVLDYMVEKYDVNIVLLPHEISGLKNDDLFFCEMILRYMVHKDRAEIVNAKTLDEFKTYLSKLDMIVSSRMHPTVLACSDNVPAVVIAYDHKQTGFLDQLGLNYCTIDINEVSVQKLLLKMEFAWKNRGKIRQHLALVIPGLQKDVRTNIEKVCRRFLRPYSSMHVDQIKNEGFCSGCGTCVGVCPFDAIRIYRDIKGNYVPAIEEEKCRKCERMSCIEACPGYSTNFDELNNFVFGKVPQDASICNYETCYIGHSTSKELRWNGSSGGIVTSLLIFALEEGLIDGALVTKMNKDIPLEPEVIVARTEDQIASASTSKYCPVPVNISLKKILKENGRYAIVGLPCHIEGVRKAEMLDKRLKQKIVMHIGLFCAHNVNFLATELLLDRMHVQEKDVAAISYRGKGWPGETSVRLNSGREISIKPYTKYWDPIFGSYFFTPMRCTLCTDVLNELSDISCGDAWLPELERDDIGTSILVTRTKSGEQLLHSASSKGKIEIVEIGAKKVKQSQFFSLKFKKETIAARIFLLELIGRRVPYIIPKPSASRFASYLSAALVCSTMYLSSKKRLQYILRYTPLPLLRLYSWLFLATMMVA